jgi:hypothetical protein
MRSIHVQSHIAISLEECCLYAIDRLERTRSAVPALPQAVVHAPAAVYSPAASTPHLPPDFYSGNYSLHVADEHKKHILWPCDEGIVGTEMLETTLSTSLTRKTTITT